MYDDVEDEFKKLLAQQAAAADQLKSNITNVATILGQLRTALIVNGFSTGSAEEFARDWFAALLDVDVPTSLDDDD